MRIAILIEQQYQELEVWYPFYRFKEEGFEVSMIGPEKGAVYPSKLGYPAEAHESIDNISAENFDAVIIPGGFAPDYMRRSIKMVGFVREMGVNKKLVAAICHGGWMLVSADVIKEKNVTGFFAIQDDLKNAGGIYTDKEVVQDENIITARKPDDLPVFCQTIITALKAN